MLPLFVSCVLLVVLWYSLFGVCGSTFVVTRLLVGWCLMFVVCRLLLFRFAFGVRSSLFVDVCLLCIDHVVYGLPLVCWVIVLFVVCCGLSVAC